jgi:hypothetical protein
MSDHPVEPPIVIYGAARSGTTYLVQILNKHPQIYVSDETKVFLWAHEALRGLVEAERAPHREREQPGGSRVRDRRAFLEYLRRELPRTIRDLYRELVPQARFWGDKNPHYADPRNRGCLETTLELFPGARFIHIVRDGRDVVTSGLRGVWKDFESVHRMWTSHVDVGAAFGRALPAEQYFELRYEELVEDDLALARRLFAFLDIDLHPAVERFCRSQQETRTPFCTPSRDIRSDVTGSDWSSFLDPEEQLRSLELLGDHLVRFGYENPDSLAASRAALAAELTTLGATR